MTGNSLVVLQCVTSTIFFTITVVLLTLRYVGRIIAKGGGTGGWLVLAPAGGPELRLNATRRVHEYSRLNTSVFESEVELTDNGSSTLFRDFHANLETPWCS